MSFMPRPSPDSNREVTAELNVTYEAKPSTPPTEAYVIALNSNIETADPIDITGFTTEVPAETGTKPQPIRLKFMTTQSRAAPAKKKLTKAHSSQSNSGLTEVASADREKTSKSQETLNNPMEQTKIIERILAETKYHVDNIRTNLNQSGNIKRTIKEEIQKSTKGLYNMVLQSIKINTGEAVDYNLEIDMRKPESNEHKLNELLEYIKTQTTTLERTQQEILSLRGEMKELKTRKTDETSNKIQEPKSQRIEQTGEDLRRELKEHSELLRNSFTRIEMLSDKIDNHQKVLEGTTYASVAAGWTAKNPPQTTTLHSVIVTSTNETDTGDEVIQKFKDAVKDEEGWITVDKIRKAKDRKKQSPDLTAGRHIERALVNT
ncbi:unnamed protein product, partial [Brenthis ino]